MTSKTSEGANGHPRTGELFLVLLQRRLKLTVKRTVLGFVLPVAVPLILFVLYLFVFHTVFRTGIPRYPVYLFAGLIPWTFLSQTLGATVASVSGEAEMVRRVPFPYELLVLATTGAGLTYLLVILAGFVGYLAATGQLVWINLPFLAIPTIALYLFVSGVGLVLAVVDIYNRDLRLLLGNIITAWFFVVPVAYSLDALTAHLGFLVSDDPVSFIVGDFREVLYEGRVVDPQYTAVMMGVCIAFFLVCLLLFRRVGHQLARDV